MNLQNMVSIEVSFFLLCVLPTGRGANILSVAFWSTASHKITYQPLLEALAAKGHNVTVLSPIPSKKSVPNLREILTANFAEYVSSGQVTKLRNVFEMKEQNQWIIPTHFIHMVVDFCAFTLDQVHLQDLQKEKFDLILMPMLYNECAAAYAHTFNTSTILLSPISVVGQISSIYGNPSPTSYIPNAFTGYSDRMTFFQRTANFLAEALVRAIYNFKFLPAMESVFREKFNDPNFPSMDDILKNSSIILSNSHFSISKARPFLPDIIEVGGMHCRQPKPLPKDLEDFIQTSGSDGFILFSMGSTVSSSEMPEHKRIQFTQAFSKLNQTVLWKWELDTPFPNLPKNVKLSKWLPQQDLLGHPKIKAFITHGGFGSTTEGVCHGTPLVGIPVFADQNMNMEGAEKAGFAITVDFAKLTGDSLFNDIQRLVNTASYKENAMRLSQLLRDQPTPALERAVYWTEYVMRHQGAVHLRSSARDLNFFVYHSLDVIGFLILMTCLLFLVTFVIIRWFATVIYKFVVSTTRSTLSLQKKKK